MYLSDTTLFDGIDMCRTYYIKNYMFRHLTMAIFRLYMKYLLSSYTKHIWAVYSGAGRRGGGTRSRMCHRGCEVLVRGGGGGLYYYML